MPSVLLIEANGNVILLRIDITIKLETWVFNLETKKNIVMFFNLHGHGYIINNNKQGQVRLIPAKFYTIKASQYIDQE